MVGKGIGSHTKANRGATDSWITPRYIIEDLGPFDLDPCAAIPQPWPCAAESWTSNGICRDWFGRVWLNPPYGKQTGSWLSKLADHGRGTALIFARTETAMFFEHVWRKADALLFIEGRIHFHYPNGTRAKGNAGGPNVLVAYGLEDVGRLRRSEIKGAFVLLGSS